MKKKNDGGGCRLSRGKEGGWPSRGGPPRAGDACVPPQTVLFVLIYLIFRSKLILVLTTYPGQKSLSEDFSHGRQPGVPVFVRTDPRDRHPLPSAKVSGKASSRNRGFTPAVALGQERASALAFHQPLFPQGAGSSARPAGWEWRRDLETWRRVGKIKTALPRQCTVENQGPRVGSEPRILHDSLASSIQKISPGGSACPLESLLLKTSRLFVNLQSRW